MKEPINFIPCKCPYKNNSKFCCHVEMTRGLRGSGGKKAYCPYSNELKCPVLRKLIDKAPGIKEYLNSISK